MIICYSNIVTNIVEPLLGVLGKGGGRGGVCISDYLWGVAEQVLLGGVEGVLKILFREIGKAMAGEVDPLL